MANVSGFSASSYADVYDPTSSALTKRINSTNFNAASDDELMEVAKEFESYLVEQVMKSMEKMASVDSSEENGGKTPSLFNSLVGNLGESDSAMTQIGDYYGDELISQLASTVTKNLYNNGGQGLGLAKQLYEQMKRNYQTVPSVEEVKPVLTSDDNNL